MQEALQKNQERVEKEQAEALKKEHYWILRGKVGFAKKVFNELLLENQSFCIVIRN